MPDALIFAALPARRAGAALILDIRDPLPEFFASKFGRRWFGRAGFRAAVLEEQWASRTADLVLTANELHLHRTLARSTHRTPVHVVPNYADASVCPMLPPRVSGPVLGYHGTVAPRMSLDLVVTAQAELRAGGVPIRFVIFGDGDGVPALQVLGERLGLADALSVTGERFQVEEVAARLHAVGLGVVSLQRDPLTDLFLSMKLLEYVRLGIPALVTWTPTLAHYFPEDTVFFVREASVLAWMHAIKDALRDPAAAQARAQRAQRLPVAQPWQVIEGAYLALIAGAPRRHRTFLARGRDD